MASPALDPDVQAFRMPAEWEPHESPKPEVAIARFRSFNDPSDRVELGALGGLFTDRPVVGIHAVDLVWGLGTLHCLTQQQPRA